MQSAPQIVSEVPQVSPFYLLLQSTIDGAAQRGLPRKQLAEMLRPIIFPDDEEYDTDEAAAELGKARSTLERWRCYGTGPKFFRDEHGCIRYTGRTLREYREKSRFASP